MQKTFWRSPAFPFYTVSYLTPFESTSIFRSRPKLEKVMYPTQETHKTYERQLTQFLFDEKNHKLITAASILQSHLWV